MHIENMKVFCDLVEHHSFSQAAKLNSITQSAVSQQLRSIEELLEAKIVDRSQKQFRLTPEGEIFHHASKEILRTYEQLRLRLQAQKGAINGALRLSCVYSVGLYVLPPHVKKFIKSHPEVSFQLEYRNSDAIYEDILQGIADLGIVGFPQKSRQIEVIPFMEDRLVLICAPENPLAKLKVVQPRDISRQRLISFCSETSTRKASERFFHDLKINFAPAIEMGNIETLKHAVEVNSGIALVPHTTVQQEIKIGALVRVELKSKPFMRKLGIIHHKNKLFTPAMKSFIDTLTAKKPLP